MDIVEVDRNSRGGTPEALLNNFSFMLVRKVEWLQEQATRYLQSAPLCERTTLVTGSFRSLFRVVVPIP